MFPGTHKLPRYASPPYGETYFHHPTGRTSDGRTIIDFMAEYYGLPLIPPYIRGVNQSSSNFGAGINFAVVGAPALDVGFYEERRIHFTTSNISMRTQLSWFKGVLPSLCRSSSCRELFNSSLIVMGPFGGNDYGHSFLQGRSLEETKTLVPLVINAISISIQELINLGVKNIMVPGMLPDGCLPISLTMFKGYKKEDYDPITGCLIWLNDFSKYHNELLQAELTRIRQRHRNAVVMYANYYDALMQLYLSPEQYGFGGEPLTACCGAGGIPYNYDSDAVCGDPPSRACAQPSLYISWDGAHCTEAAYRFITKSLLEGPYTAPHINSSCSLITEESGYSSAATATTR
ncbi:GDSL esterase/lipase At1g28580-like [Coffea arabica]|uniref:GDSL esterase/lipase At1g28580-like n=1 Tax=Coffea arabica TaxID=13443 RepID=A0A6P6VFS7_COFAR